MSRLTKELLIEKFNLFFPTNTTRAINAERLREILGDYLDSLKFLIESEHTIFTPLTGETVTIINNSLNIIHPSTSLSTLNIYMPVSPVNGDCVKIKFTNSVETVTYLNGTVVCGNTAPIADTLVTLTYDLTSNKWF